MTTHHDPDTLRAAALTSARHHGCICTPEVTLTEEAEGIHRATIRHDPWCPVLLATAAPWN